MTKKHQGIATEKYATKEFDMVRSKTFNFCSTRSTIIAKLKTESYQKKETCKYKMDTSNDGNLMPIRMYKMLFPYTNITDLNKSVNKK